MRSSWPDWFVMELSSFQLELMQQRSISFGCWLNLEPNHLDWHADMNEYRQAKEKIVSLVRPEGICVVHESIVCTPSQGVRLLRYGKNSTSDLFYRQAQVLLYGKPQGALPEVLVEASAHDKENYLAAFALSSFAGVGTDVIRESYETFKKPSHRIEFVIDRRGIQFWDDSKGTNVAATIAAVEAVPGPIVLIAGGVHKGASYSPWKEAFKGKVKAIFAIGQAKELIAQDVGDFIPVRCVDSLEEAVRCSTAHLTAPFSVLLSPGCSSYDMFCDYKERGSKFQEIVRAI
jgi:UDP-N-acetylmuramoylalanine--D-glutamate ligase